MVDERWNSAWQTIFYFRTNQLPEYNEDRVREYHDLGGHPKPASWGHLKTGQL